MSKTFELGRVPTPDDLHVALRRRTANSHH